MIFGDRPSPDETVLTDEVEDDEDEEPPSEW
jgi:hypothetical protein